MEELKEKILRLKDEVNQIETNLNFYKGKLFSLQGLSQPTTYEFHNGMNKYFTVEVKEMDYEHILGGDGRSSPYSETRKGMVALISIKDGIYLSENQYNIVKEYVNESLEPDHIKLKVKA